MNTWLSRMRQALRDEQEERVRRALDEAQHCRARVELEPLTPSGAAAGPLVTAVEQVRMDDFVVGQPTIGGVVRPLARFEPYLLRCVLSGGIVTGSTCALGRIRIPSGNEGELFGYRLEIPSCVEIVQQRPWVRALMGRDGVREAELHVFSHSGPILGLVREINPSGALLLCRNGQDHIASGQDAYFKLDLPDPVGPIREMVHVIGIAPDTDSDRLLVRVGFEKKNPAIANALGRR